MAVHGSLVGSCFCRSGVGIVSQVLCRSFYLLHNLPKLSRHIRGLLGNPAQFNSCHFQEDLRILDPLDQCNDLGICPPLLTHNSLLIRKSSSIQTGHNFRPSPSATEEPASKTSLVLVTRRQVQPVSLWTRSSADPGDA